ncbi:prolyl-tRNA synthetase associated domain-containing protein [Neobacillus mesonae]|uniref:Prolyl-tRNA synthetase associated domain-containing protein n=1 Tax=Neobacillus mesonae TaxID=1193713 RepID=A0A3Q9QZ95_9BACI|nr:prolyl-tRNA synthetase associated domain-containing protein [Neobacillus mesonae]AZU62349.1 prolyl-tRNA synthetase associated domain-containing protein [Neobacillus mesonae]
MSQKKLVFDKLENSGIKYKQMDHPPVYTIEDMEELKITEHGEVCKNLFLRDAKGKRHFLVVLGKDKQADIKSIQAQLGCSRLSFASEERLQKYLQLQKGAVTPLGVINDTEAAVEIVLDSSLEGKEQLGFHPNDNTATIWISYGDLIKFIRMNGNNICHIEI